MILEMIEVDPSAGLNLEWLGPIVTAVGGVIVAIIGGIAMIWRRRQERQDEQEDRAEEATASTQPKVVDGWSEVRAARAEATKYYNLYRTFEDMYFTVISALRGLVRSVREAHPEQKFSKEVVDALAVKGPEPGTK